MARASCHRCRRPAPICVCSAIRPVTTRTHWVLLMHPKEARKVRIGTGRLTHLSLRRSELHVGIGFNDHPRVTALLGDQHLDCRMLYPGGTHLNTGAYQPMPGRIPVFFLLDATWPCARAMLRASPRLASLPRITFDPPGPSAFSIKRQPRAECLATIEAADACLNQLVRHGHERLPPDHDGNLLGPLRKLMAIQQRFPGAPPALATAPSGCRDSAPQP
ncbi:MAG: hypothetical protein CL483_14555 [Acidobacteria bacterium]|nr:hypothetical protein [Acidobacteriota bacterium]